MGCKLCVIIANIWADGCFVKILRPACKQRSLTHLAVVDGFEGNPAGRRGLRVGIDASIWFYHAAYGKEGENPELRTMFFRCARLMNKPFLPLFVFDGPKRPSTKRKKKVSGKDHWLTSGMQKIIEAFGFEWRMVWSLNSNQSCSYFLLGSRRGWGGTGLSQSNRCHWCHYLWWRRYFRVWSCHDYSQVSSGSLMRLIDAYLLQSQQNIVRKYCSSGQEFRRKRGWWTC